MTITRPAKSPIYVLSNDSTIMKSLTSLEVDYLSVEPGKFPVSEVKFDLCFDLDSYDNSVYKDILEAHGNSILNKLILCSGKPTMQNRISLAVVGVDYIGDKNDLLLELGSFIRNTNEDSVKKIMVIDDSPTDLFTIKKSLIGAGYDAHVFEDTLEAINSIDKIEPDLVLVDIHMPEPLDGPTFVRVVRQMSKYSSLPVVFISGESNDLVKITALESGADDFISKPFNPAIATRVINKNIRRSEQQKD